MFSKIITKNILVTLIIILTATPQAYSKSDWASVKADLTLQEYFNIYFLSHIKPHSSDEKVETYFVANSSPKDAILYIVLPIVVPVSDLPTRANLVQSLKKKTNLYLKHVDKLFQEPSVAKRWQNANTKDNLIIHMIDSHNRSKTVGIYESGSATFDEQKNKEKLLNVRKLVGNFFAK